MSTLQLVLEAAKWADHFLNGAPRPGGEAAKPEAVINSLLNLNKQYEKAVEILSEKLAHTQVELANERAENSVLTAEVVSLRAKTEGLLDDCMNNEVLARRALAERDHLKGIIERHGVPIDVMPLVKTEVKILPPGDSNA